MNKKFALIAGGAVIAPLSLVLAGVVLAADKDSDNSRSNEAPRTTQDSTPAREGEQKIEIAFITHLDAGLAEQDVYIEREPGSGKVFRITGGDHNMKAPIYKAAVKVAKNPRVQAKAIEVFDDKIKHFCSRKHFNLPCLNLSRQGLVGSDEKLLSCLTSCIRSP